MSEREPTEYARTGLMQMEPSSKSSLDWKYELTLSNWQSEDGVPLWIDSLLAGDIRRISKHTKEFTLINAH